MRLGLPSREARPKGGVREIIMIVVHAFILAFLVRVFFYQPFNIPSGSMLSTLLIGDYLFVSKLSYGYSRYTFRQQFSLCVPRTDWCTNVRLFPDLFDGRIFAGTPKRGDVAVFKLPRDNQTDYIKRIMGLPGDVIEVKGGVVFINGIEVKRERVDDFVEVDDDGTQRRTPRYRETLPEGRSYLVLDAQQNGQYDNVGPYRVPEGHYFMMGDNRDNSTDSREQSPRYGVGYVPFENLVGRAEIIFFSAATEEAQGHFRITRPWTWSSQIRWSRFFNVVR